jgi:hypothetical protein
MDDDDASARRLLLQPVLLRGDHIGEIHRYLLKVNFGWPPARESCTCSPPFSA